LTGRARLTSAFRGKEADDPAVLPMPFYEYTP
jgi:hypothetical protein